MYNNSSTKNQFYLQNKRPKIISLHIFGLKLCLRLFIPICRVNAVQDDISTKTVQI